MQQKPHCSGTAGDPARAAEVFYDGACPVCSREIDTYRKVISEDRVTWSDVSAAGDMVTDHLSRQDALARFHVRRANGQIVSGAGAFLAIWRNVGKLRWLAIALDRQPFLWIGDLLYGVFLRFRPLWRRAG